MVTTLKNWTIPPIEGKSPIKAGDGLWQPFPCVKGDTTILMRADRRRPLRPGERGIVEPAEILSSRITAVHVTANGIFVNTKGGTTYHLEGPPRPSFWEHCKAFGIKPSANAARALWLCLM